MLTLPRILDFIRNHYDLEDLKTLCFQLNVKYDDLPGDRLTSKTRELINYLQRQARIGDLLDQIQHDRPQPFTIWQLNRDERAIAALNVDPLPISEELHFSRHASRIEAFLNEYLGSVNRPVPFGGRDKNLDELDNWLNDESAPAYALLSAEAGRGKSALLARWFVQRQAIGDRHIIFIPVSIRFETASEQVFYEALTQSLETLYNRRFTYGRTVTEMRDIVFRLLRQPRPDGRPLLLILDGLDEAFWPIGPAFLPSGFNEQLRVIVASRAWNAQKWLKILGWERSGVASVFSLDNLDRMGIADVLSKIPWNKLSNNVDIVARLDWLTEGDPLLVRLYIDALWEKGKGGLDINVDDLASLAPGLAGYFERWWDDQMKVWGSDFPLGGSATKAFFNLLACALGPLSRRDVLAMAPVGLDISSWVLDKITIPLGRLVIGDGRQIGYGFAHPKLGFFFYNQLLIDGEVEEWENCFLTYGAETIRTLDTGELSPGDTSKYLIHHYVKHLTRSQKTKPQDYYKIINKHWLRAWGILEGTYTGFLYDIKRVWEVADAEQDIIWQIRCALLYSSIFAVIAQLPSRLLAQMIKAGLWTPEQAVEHYRVTAPDRFDEELSELIVLLPDRLKEFVLKDVIEVGSEHWRLEQLISLIPHLTVSLLEKTLNFAKSLPDAWDQSQLLFALYKHSHPTIQAATLKSIYAISQAYYRIWALVSLMEEGLLSRTDFEEALNFCYEQAKMLVDDDEQTAAFSWLIPLLKGERKPEVFEKAIVGLERMEDSEYKCALMIEMFSHLTEGQKQRILDITKTIKEERFQAYILFAVGAHISENLAKKNFEIGQGVFSNDAVEYGVVQAGQYIPPHIKEQIIDLVKPENLHELKVLSDWLPYLESNLNHKFLQKLSQAIENLSTLDDWLIKMIDNHIHDLPRELKIQLISLARKSKDIYYFVQLAKDLPEFQDEVLQEIHKSGSLEQLHLLTLTPYLPKEKQEQVLQEALKLSYQVNDWFSLSEIFLSPGSGLEIEEREQVLNQAMAHAKYSTHFLTIYNYMQLLWYSPHVTQETKEGLLEYVLSKLQILGSAYVTANLNRILGLAGKPSINPEKTKKIQALREGFLVPGMQESYHMGIFKSITDLHDRTRGTPLRKEINLNLMRLYTLWELGSTLQPETQRLLMSEVVESVSRHALEEVIIRYCGSEWPDKFADHAISLYSNIKDPEKKVTVAHYIGRFLNDDDKDLLFETVKAIESKELRLYGLATLAPHFSQRSQQIEAVQLAYELTKHLPVGANLLKRHEIYNLIMPVWASLDFIGFDGGAEWMNLLNVLVKRNKLVGYTQFIKELNALIPLVTFLDGNQMHQQVHQSIYHVALMWEK